MQRKEQSCGERDRRSLIGGKRCGAYNLAPQFKDGVRPSTERLSSLHLMSPLPL